MSTGERTTDEARRMGLLGVIYDLALGKAVLRLQTISPQEESDNVAYDRAARTAQIFVRTALEVDALLSRRQQKAGETDATAAQCALPNAEDVAELGRRLIADFDRAYERNPVAAHPAVADGAAQ
jgi:hypothetical protein